MKKAQQEEGEAKSRSVIAAFSVLRGYLPPSVLPGIRYNFDGAICMHYYPAPC